MRLSGVASTNSSAVRSTGNQAYGLRGRDLGHGREQLAHRGAVVVGRDTEVRPPGDVPQRERRVRLEHLVRDLRRMERRLERERSLALRLERPLRTLAVLLHAPDRVERLGAAHDGDIEVAAHDRLGGVVDEHLRRRAADAGVEAVPRLDAEPVARAAPAGRRTATTGSTRSATTRPRRARPASRRRRRPRLGRPAPTARAVRATDRPPDARSPATRR